MVENTFEESCEKDIKEGVSILRSELKSSGKKIQILKNACIFQSRANADDIENKCDYGEMIANSVLAYRNLEDSIMRLGKVLQAENGGESIYDKK